MLAISVCGGCCDCEDDELLLLLLAFDRILKLPLEASLKSVGGAMIVLLRLTSSLSFSSSVSRSSEILLTPNVVSVIDEVGV